MSDQTILNESLDSRFVSITPSDTVEVGYPDALWVGGVGTLVVNDGVKSVTFTGASGWMPIPQVKRIMAASTATGIVAVWNRKARS